MAGAQLVVYGGGRWRALDVAAGRVSGWGAVRLLRVRRGRLELLRRAPVLRALGAFVAGRASAVKEGPRLSQIRSDRREHSWRRDSSRRKSRRGSCKCTCCPNPMHCSMGAVFSSTLKPATSTVAVQCEQTTTTRTKLVLSPEHVSRHHCSARPGHPDIRHQDAIEAQVVVRNETHEPVSDDSDADFQRHKKNKLKKKDKQRSGTKVLLVRRNETWEAVSQDTNTELRHKRRDKRTEAVQTVASPLRKNPVKITSEESESEGSVIFQTRKKVNKHDSGHKTGVGNVKATGTIVISSDSDLAATKQGDKLRKRNQKRQKSRSTKRSRQQQEDSKELVISEQVVMLLRDFIERDEDNSLGADLERFDADDRYKAGLFYRLNPLVSLERSRVIARMLQRRQRRADAADTLSQKEFATRLGLLSVDELSQSSRARYRMRARDVTSQRTRSIIDSDSEVDKENNSHNTAALKKSRVIKGSKPQSTLKREIDKNKSSKRNEEIEHDSSNSDSDAPKTNRITKQNTSKPQSRVNREVDKGNSSKRNKEVEHDSSNSDSDAPKKNRITKQNITKTQNKLNKEVDTNKSSKRNKEVDQNSSNSDSDAPKTNGITKQNSSKPQSREVDKEKNSKRYRELEQNSTNTASPKKNREIDQNITKAKTRLNREVDKENSSKRNREVEHNSSDSEFDTPKKNREKDQNSTKAKTRLNRKDDNENSSKRNREVEQNSAKAQTRLTRQIDKENNSKRNREVEQDTTKSGALASVGKNRAVDNETLSSDSDFELKGPKQTKNVLEEKVSRQHDTRGADKKRKAPVEPAGGASKPLVRVFREYTAEEDASIVRWVSDGGRARLVNGNRLWKQLQQVHQERTGCFRSWHSLRNRYLRYLLPTLGARDLPPQQASRLRAAAAAGELKSRKLPPRRNSVFHVPRVRSASARRPAPPPTPAHPPAPALAHIAESDTEDTPTRTLRSNAAQTLVSQPDQPASRTPQNDQSTSRAPQNNQSTSRAPQDNQSKSRTPQNDQPAPRVRRAHQTLTPTYSELTKRFALRHRSTPNTDSVSVASVSSASASVRSASASISSASVFNTDRPTRRSKRLRSTSSSSMSTDNDRPRRKITRRDTADRSGRQNSDRHADNSGPERRLTRSVHNSINKLDRRSPSPDVLDQQSSEDVINKDRLRDMSNQDVNKKGRRRDKINQDVEKKDRNRDKINQDVDKKDRNRDKINQDVDKKDRNRDKINQDVDKKDRHRDKGDQDVDKKDRQNRSKSRRKGADLSLINGHVSSDSDSRSKRDRNKFRADQQTDRTDRQTDGTDRQTDRTDRQKPRTRRLYNPNAI